MAVKIHENLVQGSDEWHEARRGLITASEMKLIVSKGVKLRAHYWELLSQRISGYTEPTYYSADMQRGHDDEVDARELYEEFYAPVRQVGFITNDKWGFTLGYSPDGLVGDDGLIETKSRKQKFHVETIMSGEVPEEFLLQIQTGLLVSERSWCDFNSYCGGLPMFTKRVYADLKMQTLIIESATRLEEELAEGLRRWRSLSECPDARLIPTERRECEIYIGGE